MRTDLMLHLVIGFLLAFVPSVLITWGGAIEPRLTLGLTIGAMLSLGATLAKDLIWDLLLGKGIYDLKDILFGVIGCTIGLALTVLITYTI